jgi:hypothetical protein
MKNEFDGYNWKFKIDFNKDRDIKGWNRFVREGMPEDFEDINSNVKYDFTKMSKMFGIYYLAYLEAAYYAKDSLTIEEFCKYNGNVPIDFLKRF